MCQLVYCQDGEICSGEVLYVDMLREQLESIYYPQTVGAGNINSVTPVVVKGRSDVPGIHSMWCPGAALLGFDIYHSSGAR
jgi:hypothetical protein